MRKPVAITHTMQTKTKVTDDIMGMLSALATWKPKTLEQVITVGERLIHAANDAIVNSSENTGADEKKAVFNGLVGKMIKYPNGIKDSIEYLYVEHVDFVDVGRETRARVTGVRLSKFNRIGNDTLQVFTLPVPFSNIVDIGKGYVEICANGFTVRYEVVMDPNEYHDVYDRIRTINERVSRIPNKLAKGTCKVSFAKKTVAKTGKNDDIICRTNETNIQRGQPCQTPPTYTKTNKEVLNSCAEPLATTSSLPGMTGNGMAKCTRLRRASVISPKNVSRKSQATSRRS